MKWGAVMGITLLIVLIALYEWPKMQLNKKKDKAVFAALSILGWMLGVILVFYPDLPSPTNLMDKLFEPISRKLME